MSIGWIIIIIAVLALVYLISIYNKLVRLKNQFQNAFAQIEVQLKRRHDLIPNLVNTAKAYLAHESETLEAVVQARNQAAEALPKAAKDPTNTQAMEQLGGAESALTGAMGRLNVVMEAYPDLKANTNMMQLSEELTSTENRVAFSRQAYNDSVMTYNSYRQSFPPVAVAPFFGHGSDANLLEFEDSAEIQAAPKVEF
ncbi:LemA family protein [Pseudidiomarina salinarum]|uniref:LemA family protein n=1 Tax=Pseudidiomarina salinarum TaxID=435908 RepID=A0A094IU00_9GAMM|nr:LemA family protein [Pseudidiomarina salinarum]KFZ30612.1 LemA family protein [Pseudidiomarina salinarum]RUO69125.1 LemA family protein [Pseudidiomarina salinarum]